MLRTVGRLTPCFITIFHKRNPNDQNKINRPAPTVPETGWDRVKKMYAMNEFDEYSVELHTVVHSTLSGAFLGACLGGWVHTRNAYIYFIENNQATIFKSTSEAKKKLQDFVMVAFAKGAVQWGWRVAAFTGIFTLVSTTISVYRGDTSLIEYIAAGTIAGGLYKANLGAAATLVGAGLGAVLSTLGGLAILGVLRATGLTMDDIRKALFKIKIAREDQMRQVAAKASEELNDPLVMHHTEIVQNKGETHVEKL